MNERACPACLSADPAAVLAEDTADPAGWDSYAFASRKLPEYTHHRMVLCGACDLAYASPAPEPDLLAGAYREASYDSGLEAGYASRTYARLLAAVVPRLVSLEGALDIGTGNGAFLEELMAAGFQGVEGVEPSLAPVEAAKPHIRPLIQVGSFTPALFGDRRFSLITCFQTMEHVYDPRATCADMCTLLRDGGAVLIVCHDRNALSARVLRTKSPIFDVEHLQLYSRESLVRLLRATGFVDVGVRTVVNRYPLNYWVKLFPMPPGPKRALMRRLEQRHVGRIPVPLAAGNFAAVAFRR